MINLNNFAHQAFLTACERQSNGAKLSTETMPMLKHCSTEVLEAAEAYCFWKSRAEDKRLTDDLKQCAKKSFSYELADVICCILIIADRENIDIEMSLSGVMAKNKRRADGKGDKK